MAKDLLPYYKYLKDTDLYDWECQADQLIRQLVPGFDPEHNAEHYSKRFSVCLQLKHLVRFPSISKPEDVINFILTEIAKKPYIQVVKD